MHVANQSAVKTTVITLTLLHSERPKLHRVLAILSAIWLDIATKMLEHNSVGTDQTM